MKKERINLNPLLMNGIQKLLNSIHPHFNLQSGLTRSSRACSSALQFFRLFITLSLRNHIVKATNEYGLAQFKENWTQTNDSEIDQFIAAIIYMGIYRHPTIKSYWSIDSRSPFVTKLFPSRVAIDSFNYIDAFTLQQGTEIQMIQFGTSNLLFLL
jgi:hypothetical protein